MNDNSQNQGWAICGAAALAALLFLIGILNGSYWAIALPVAILVFFVLGLVAWVGYTIATVQVEPEPVVEATPSPPPSPAPPDPAPPAGSDAKSSEAPSSAAG